MLYMYIFQSIFLQTVSARADVVGRSCNAKNRSLSIILLSLYNGLALL